MAEVRLVDTAWDAAWVHQSLTSTRWLLTRQRGLVAAYVAAMCLLPLAVYVALGGLLSWRAVAVALMVSLVSVALVPVLAIAIHLCRFCVEALLGRAVLFVSDDDGGWGCVTVRRQLGPRNAWSVQNLLTVPEGSLHGALSARALIRWADGHHLTLTTVPRDERLCAHYIKSSVGFHVDGKTLTRRTRLTRSPRTLRVPHLSARPVDSTSITKDD